MREDDRAAMVGGCAFGAILIVGVLCLNAIPPWVMAVPLGLVVLTCTVAVGWAAHRRWSQRRVQVADRHAQPGGQS